MRRGIDVLLGVVYVCLGALVLVASMAAYQKTFVDDVRVEVEAGTVGNALQRGSEVKYLGVPVGTVADVRPLEGGARLTLSLDPGLAGVIPRGSTVRMVPETLFGERYVDIVQVGSAQETGLRDGDVLAQDTSDEALAVEDLFDSLLPVLTAVEPAALNATLSELAAALRDQGDDIGAAFEEWGAYLRRLNPELPALARDLDLLGEVAETYADAAPDLLTAMDDLAVVSRTVIDRRRDLDGLFTAVIDASDTTTGWLAPEVGTIDALSAESRAVLEILAHYAPTFPCVGKALTALIPRTDAALGAGTREPGLHVELRVVPARSGYRPGVDSPSLAGGGPARCPRASGSSDPALAGLPAWAPLVAGPAVVPAGAS